MYNLIQPGSVSPPPLGLRLHSSLIASTPLQAGCRLQVPLDTDRRNNQWIHMWEDSANHSRKTYTSALVIMETKLKLCHPPMKLSQTQKSSVRHLAGPEHQACQCHAPGIAVGSVLAKVIDITWQRLLNFFSSSNLFWICNFISHVYL